MLKIILSATLLFYFGFAQGAQLTVGIVPQQSAKKLASLWTPILKHLSAQSGETLVFVTAKNIPTFEERLAQGDYDLAYMNPYHFVVFNQSTGYQALAKQKDKQIRGIIVVRKDSDITNLQQLNNRSLAFPAPAAFAASILPRAELTAQSINFTPKYVSSHDSVYLNVAKGFFPAGGGVLRTFGNAPKSIQEQLDVLWTTKGYTPHAFATHPNVDEQTRARILKAMLRMNDTDEGRALLKSINFKGLEKAFNTDWEDINTLGISSLNKPVIL